MARQVKKLARPWTSLRLCDYDEKHILSSEDIASTIAKIEGLESIVEFLEACNARPHSDLCMAGHRLRRRSPPLCLAADSCTTQDTLRGARIRTAQRVLRYVGVYIARRLVENSRVARNADARGRGTPWPAPEAAEPAHRMQWRFLVALRASHEARAQTFQSPLFTLWLGLI